MTLPNVVFVLGAPGAGKGTQCSKLSNKYGYSHLSAGDLLRAEVKDDGPDGALIAGIMLEGRIVPSSITVNLLSRAIQKVSSQKTPNSTFLIDGFPRTQENWSTWQEIIGEKANVRFMLFYECSESVCTDRVLNRQDGRVDDTEKIVKKRIETYNISTVPVIEDFRTAGMLRVVQAAAPIEQVAQDTEIFMAEIHDVQSGGQKS
ncbi:UMP-CMP kinase 1-like [Bolinopsis microptera]|uniref:UMP-CMP kinase 1-like n=1 Tax=Bolinopsis microptera TaxID=2820187 RepID=UPI0030794C46